VILHWNVSLSVSAIDFTVIAHVYTDRGRTQPSDLMFIKNQWFVSMTIICEESVECVTMKNLG